MLSIFICEDDKIQRKAIETYINNFIMIEELDMKIEISTDNPHRIIDYLKMNANINGIYFLDVNLKSDINGIQLGGEIRNMDIGGKIIFITTHSEMMFLTFKYKVEAMDYIIKNEKENLQQRIIEALNQAKKHYQIDTNHQEERIKIKIGSKIRVFPLQEVIFFETSQVPHKLVLHLSQGSVDFYGKIAEMETMSDSLIRVHKSFVINLENVTALNQKKFEVTMINGETCPIAIRKIPMLNKRLR